MKEDMQKQNYESFRDLLKVFGDSDIDRLLRVKSFDNPDDSKSFDIIDHICKKRPMSSQKKENLTTDILRSMIMFLQFIYPRALIIED